MAAEDLRPGAAVLVTRMKDSGALALLAEALGKLSDKLSAEDLRPGAEPLVARMMTEGDSYALASLGQAFGKLSEKLSAEDLRLGAAVLVQEMKCAGLFQANGDVPWDVPHVHGENRKKLVTPGRVPLLPSRPG